jgi:predicted Zn-dependent protease
MLKDRPDDVEVLGLKAWYEQLRGRPAEAATAYRRILAQSPGSRIASQLAQALWQAGDRAGAIRTLEQWTAGHPEDSLGRYLLAGLYQSEQRHDDAGRQLQRVLEISPHNVMAMDDLACLLRKSEPRRALELAERAARKDPASPALLDTLAAVLLDQGQTGRAAEALRRAVAIDPGNPSLKFRLALDEAGRTRDSLDSVKALLSDDPTFPERKEAQELLKSVTAQAGG